MEKGIRSIIIGIIVIVVLFFIGRYVWREVQKAMVAKSIQESTVIIEEEVIPQNGNGQ
ncbi:MAG TPA: hypothetical protein PLU71_05105 [Candidatus Dependentiae bacterium]|nr:hypothetical protein [Candidatus Dependentiae bacterium]HRQ63213.1 hypothetical protein [Candidatus Dependentiae bacterium]